MPTINTLAYFPSQSEEEKVLNYTTLLNKHAQYFINHVSALQNFFLCHWRKPKSWSVWP